MAEARPRETTGLSRVLAFCSGETQVRPSKKEQVGGNEYGRKGSRLLAKGGS